jgi:hypothetical protein
MDGDDKPITNIHFTEVEALANAKIERDMLTGFYKNHPELTANSNSDLLNMHQQDKQLYISMAIKYAVNGMAALRKSKEMKV